MRAWAALTMRRGGCGWSQRRAPRFYFFPLLAPRVKRLSIRIRKVKTSCVLTSSAVTWLSPQHCGDFQPAAHRCNFHKKVFYYFYFFLRCPLWWIYQPLFPIPDPKVRCWSCPSQWHHAIFLKIYILLLILPFFFSLLKPTLLLGVLLFLLIFYFYWSITNSPCL